MNIEHPTSNIEWKKMKKQSLKPELLNDILKEIEKLIKISVRRIKTAEKKQSLNVLYWMFVFLFDVGRSSFNTVRLGPVDAVA